MTEPVDVGKVAKSAMGMDAASGADGAPGAPGAPGADGADALTRVARGWLNDLFAPWVRALNLRVERVHAEGAHLRLPFDPALCRTGGTICGQALMAAADTSMVMAIGGVLGEFRPMTTVSQTMNFMRPVAGGDVMILARVVKPGRTIMFGEITLTGADGKVVAAASCTYAMV